jgi:F-type H+-transporting ATPase subunit c
MIIKNIKESSMKRNLLLSFATFMYSAAALAEDAAGAASGQGGGAMVAIGAAVAIGLAAAGGALGQGKVGAAAMDGIARNPQAQKSMFVPMIIGLALIESLVIYALVIAYQLVGKI